MPVRRLAATLTLVLPFALNACSRAAEDDGLRPASPDSVIRIEVTGTGFTPSDIELSAGVPTVLEFIRTAETTCVTAVDFPESGIRHELPLNEPVRISVHPKSGQRIAFACPMEMYTGSFGTSGPTAAASDPPVALQDGIQEIRVDQQGFHPGRIQIAAGEPAILRFRRVAENTCNTAVVIPSLGIEKDLPLNESVDVTVSPESPGDIAFACPMEMSTGVIEVREGGGQ